MTTQRKTTPSNRPTFWWENCTISREHDVVRLKPAPVDPSEKRSGFETKKMAQQDNERAINCLEAGKGVHDESLGASLTFCDEVDPCGSPACRLCARRFRRAIVADMLGQLTSDSITEVRLVTIALPFYGGPWFDQPWRTWPSPWLMAQGVRMMLRREGISGQGIGCIEVDFSRETGHVEPHCHLVLADFGEADAQRLRSRLLSKNGEAVRRPLVVSQPVPREGLADVTSYIVKFRVHEKQHYTQTVGGLERTHSRKVNLRGERFRCMLHWLNRWDFDDFIVRLNFRRKI